MLLSQVYGPVTFNTTPSFIVVSEKNGMLTLWQRNILGFRSFVRLRMNTGKPVRSTGLYIEIMLRAEKCVQNGTKKFFILCVFLFTQDYDTTNASAHISYL